MNKPELSIARLEASLDAKISRYFDTLDTEPDVLKQLLAHKRSENTRRAYERDVNDFLKTMTGKFACTDNVLEFLHLDERQAVSVVLKYKAKLIDKGLKEATVNQRLAAVKSLVEMGRKLGACHYTLGDIKGEKVTSYRDTTGVDTKTFERLLSGCDRTTLAGARDYALLRLLWGNALRRNEVCQLNVRDFDPASKTLRIFGKGRGTQAETLDLGSATVQAIADWLQERGSCSHDSPLFIALDSAHSGYRRKWRRHLQDGCPL
jgi:integrase/recombinase XerC